MYLSPPRGAVGPRVSEASSTVCAQHTSLARSTNDSKYGLQAGVFTHDLDKAWYAFEKLDVGGVVVGHVPSIRVDAQVSSQSNVPHPTAAPCPRFAESGLPELADKEVRCASIISAPLVIAQEAPLAV